MTLIPDMLSYAINQVSHTFNNAIMHDYTLLGDLKMLTLVYTQSHVGTHSGQFPSQDLSIVLEVHPIYHSLT